MGLLDKFQEQRGFYESEGALGANLLDFRPDLDPQVLEDKMNDAYKEYLVRLSDPVAYYQANPSAQGLLDVTPEMDVIDLIGGVVPKAAMLVGAKAMNPKSMMLDMAGKMERAGKSALEIKKATNISYDKAGSPYFEIPDTPAKMATPEQMLDRTFIGDFDGESYPYASLGNVMEHDELYKIFPDMANVDVIADPKIKGANAMYDPNLDAIKVSPDMLKSGDRDKLKEIILHESNHAIARRVKDPAGASSRNISGQLRMAEIDESKPYSSGLLEYERAHKARQDIGSAQYANKLDALSKKQNIREGDIHNLSDWYQYNDDIRSTIGSMPKSGEAKKEWLRGAAAWLRNRNEREMSYKQMGILSRIGTDKKLIDAEYRKAGRDLNKHASDAQKSSEIRRRYGRLGDISKNLSHSIDDVAGSTKVYLSEVGEQNARMTQGRRNLPYNEMRNTLPESYDPYGHLMADDYWINTPKGRYGHQVDEYIQGLLHKID